MGSSNPKNVISTGLHQKRGECYVRENDLSMYVRYRYLCEKDFDEDFHMNCLDPFASDVANSDVWYTICGKDFEKKTFYFAAQVMITLTGILLISEMLFSRETDSKNPTVQTKNEKDKKEK